ncbi:gluconate 2-dehydrogenase subunit 3 family protein [Niabella sp. CC-SYL272]|uniref:gluconate 2-dehydrogenase subunit 3 family protein n=1 Tax=Niabella agricola TaxID=2891571 RepID=UPI001F16AF36|nr:gluconate 2-dehydrogenase subunit 3 family protein [Niabella agricola]MCF3111262.1 gluconate 2-dehydrogenase subunit 3 family protein [Niabella agricola]
MNRKEAIKGLFFSATLLYLPGCLPADTKEKELFSRQESGLLLQVIETILPVRPASVKELSVFIEKTVSDCYSPEQQNNFKKGLAAFRDYVKSASGNIFERLPHPEKLKVLTAAAGSNVQSVNKTLATIKTLAIEGYRTSKYFMTSVMPYELVPGHFYGCVASHN